jgi:hypothetical protein
MPSPGAGPAYFFSATTKAMIAANCSSV